jgi:transcriptional regulator with XRE-family HTH domain
MTDLTSMKTITLAPASDSVIIEKAHKALAYLEQIEAVIISLERLKNTCEVDSRLQVEEILARVQALYKALDTQSGEEFMGKGEKLVTYTSKIQSLNLGPEILELRRKGMSLDKIAERLGISSNTVSKFLRLYDEATPSKKIEMTKRSVFNIAENYEELGAMLYRCLAKLEHVDPEQHVKYIGELRLLLTQVQKFIEHNTMRSKLDQLRMLVLEILTGELPEKRLEIIEKFRKSGIEKSLM